jgi:ribonuclease P protein component
MLPAPARLRLREDFTLAVRRGRRSGRGTLVAHYLAGPDSGTPPARAGFVVGKVVGNSVVRHRTVRRLRHLVRDRLDRLPAGSVLVVRALPPSAAADSAALGRDLDAALTRLLPATASATSGSIAGPASGGPVTGSATGGSVTAPAGGGSVTGPAGGGSVTGPAGGGSVTPPAGGVVPGVSS